MFESGDAVQVLGLDEAIMDLLSDSLDVPFEEIEFFFVELEEDNYVVLSAETHRRFAIVHVPAECVKPLNQRSEELFEEVEDLCRQLEIDYLLDHHNEVWAQEALLEYTVPKRKEAHIGAVFNEEEE